MHRSVIAFVAGVLAVSVATGAVAARAARTAAPPFELTAKGWGWDGGSAFVTDGEFTASGTFCPAGSIQSHFEPQGVVEVLTCADGSGTATVRFVRSDHGVFISPDDLTGQPFFVSGWRIVGGTGRYEKLRGQGTFTNVVMDNPEAPCVDFEVDVGCFGIPFVRSSWTGVADLDDVPPALRVVSAQASKLERPGGAYSLELALELRDEVDGAPVPYTLRVTSGVRTLAWESGTAETPNLELTVPIRPGKRALSVRLHLTASDSVGNESSLSSPMVVLPR